VSAGRAGGGRQARALGHVLFPYAGGGVDALVPGCSSWLGLPSIV
jgi:hypothetical protein